MKFLKDHLKLLLPTMYLLSHEPVKPGYGPTIATSWRGQLANKAPSNKPCSFIACQLCVPKKPQPDFGQTQTEKRGRKGDSHSPLVAEFRCFNLTLTEAALEELFVSPSLKSSVLCRLWKKCTAAQSLPMSTTHTLPFRLTLWTTLFKLHLDPDSGR